MIKAKVDINDRRRRIGFVDSIRNCIMPRPHSCECCGYVELTHLIENYYEHDVLMCQHPDTVGLIVHDYGHCKDGNGGIHPACPLCHDHPEPGNCDATKIRDSYAQIHEDGDDSFHYVLCPYCQAVNRLEDTTIGYRYCGACEKIFNVK